MKTRLFKNAFALLVVVGVLDLLARKLYLYEFTWWMDMVMHFLGGVCVGVAILSFYLFGKNKNAVEKEKIILVAILGTFAVGLVWEIYELVFGITALSDGMLYITDTTSDIVMDVAGGFLGSLYGFRIFKN